MGLPPGPEAWLISVGNEILIGRVVNTNFSWLGQQLTSHGFRVGGGIIVPDDLGSIAWAFSTAAERASIVISTGGLGPTFDDMTAEGLAKAMGVECEVNEEALRMIREKYGGELTEHRVKMARLPRGAKPFANPVGTAPGVETEWRGALIFLLPGVPAEMMAMFHSYVLPRLREKFGERFMAEKSLRVEGLPESVIAPLIEEAMRLARGVYVKSHPRGREGGFHIVLHITAYGEEPGAAARTVDTATTFLRRELEKRGAVVHEE